MVGKNNKQPAVENKQPEAALQLRFAEVEHLLKAIKLLSEEEKKSVTHQGLENRLTNIRDYWMKLERERKARQGLVLKTKGLNRVSKTQGAVKK